MATLADRFCTGPSGWDDEDDGEGTVLITDPPPISDEEFAAAEARAEATTPAQKTHIPAPKTTVPFTSVDGGCAASER